MEDTKAKAREMFAEGKNINQVAKALGIGWSTARAFKADTQEQDGEESGEDNLVFTMNLDIPVGRTIELIRGVQPNELILAIEDLPEPDQVAILQAVMQRRLDAVLTPRAAEPFELPQAVYA